MGDTPQALIEMQEAEVVKDAGRWIPAWEAPIPVNVWGVMCIGHKEKQPPPPLDLLSGHHHTSLHTRTLLLRMDPGPRSVMQDINNVSVHYK